jgi:proteic killer suppression protein
MRGFTYDVMIRSFRSRSLRAFWTKADVARVAPNLVDRLWRRLDALNMAGVPDDMNIPGFDFHKLRGKPVRYSVHVNGPWRVTFGWEGEDAVAVDLENYH